MRRLAALAGGPTTAVEELKTALRQADEDILRIGTAAGGAGGAGTTVAGVALVEDCGNACWAVFPRAPAAARPRARRGRRSRSPG